MSAIFRWGALALGVILLITTVMFVDRATAAATIVRLGFALPVALFCSGLWHLARTIAWAWCFPSPRAVGFARLARVRLAAEAFSYLTLRGIAGEPLKVVLLADRVDPRHATAAVALERIAYLVGTTLIVGAASTAAALFLPLTHGWFRVFRAFAIAAGILAVLCAAAIRGRGTYLQVLLRRLDQLFGLSLAAGRTGAFVIAVESQMLDLVRGNPARLAVLTLATIAAYVLMALEAWVIVRAVTPLSLNAAFAVETFSRVVSFASAFIPASLGALEASSLAAAAAVGASSGGAALAIARRIRGLFWAAVGLAIYPRAFGGAASSPARTDDDADVSSRGRFPSAEASAKAEASAASRTLLYLPQHSDVQVPPTARLAALPIAERVVRAARRAGYSRVLVWLPAPDTALTRLLRSLHVDVFSDIPAWRTAIAQLPRGTSVTAVGAGTVVSPDVFEAAARLAAFGDAVVDVPAGREWPESGVLRVSMAHASDPAGLATFLAERRRRASALPTGEEISEGQARLALRIVTSDDLTAAERTIRRSIFKDTDAKIARFNRRMSVPISVVLMRTPLTANQLSVVLVAMGLYSAWLFSIGHYWTGVLGAFISLAASVLDGCDGEIARLKYQESALGCWIETVGDYSYYVAIFVGLTVGAARQTAWPGFHWIGLLALVGTVVTFALLIYLRSRITAGRPEKLHTIARARYRAEGLWSRLIWRVSFVATRAAMPYGIMALALVNGLPAIVVLAAVGANVYWISLVVNMRDLMGGDERGELAV